MTSLALVDATTWVGGHDFTTDLNQISLNVEVEDLDATTFGSGGYRTRKGGLKDVEAELNGFWDSAPDSQAFNGLTGVININRVATMSPTGAETATAYLFQAQKFSYEAFGAVGKMTPFTLGMMGRDGQGVVRGQIAKAKGNVSAAGPLGSAVNLGAVSSTQFVYATVHVFSAGTTITLQLQTDDAQGFGTPTTIATIGPLTTTGGTWMARVAGPITDTWFRFNVSTVTGTFTVAGAIAVQ